MEDQAWQAEQFERHRTHLRAVAYRMLGSASEAEDAVQEAWLRLSQVEDKSVTNLAGWLTTVVGRVCLDMLRARRSRRWSTGHRPRPVSSPAAPAAGYAAAPPRPMLTCPGSARS